jgi:predicted PurR-regulated permease PerM
LLVAGLLLLVPVISDQIGRFAARLPDDVTTLIRLFNENAPEWVKSALNRTETALPGSATEIATKAAGWVAQIVQSILSGANVVFNMVSLLDHYPARHLLHAQRLGPDGRKDRQLGAARARRDGARHRA